ncbi:MAG: HAD family hydrolase [Pseudonocardiaceae bacterium]
MAVTLARQARAVGLPCAVASGAAAVLVNAGLEVLDLREEFQAVVTRDDVEHGKPAPDAFHEAAHRLGIAPEHYLAVEDAPDGLTAARRAGTRVLAVRGGHLTWPPAIPPPPSLPRTGRAVRPTRADAEPGPHSQSSHVLDTRPMTVPREGAWSNRRDDGRRRRGRRPVCGPRARPRQRR